MDRFISAVKARDNHALESIIIGDEFPPDYIPSKLGYCFNAEELKFMHDFIIVTLLGDKYKTNIKYYNIFTTINRLSLISFNKRYNNLVPGKFKCADFSIAFYRPPFISDTYIVQHDPRIRHICNHSKAFAPWYHYKYMYNNADDSVEILIAIYILKHFGYRVTRYLSGRRKLYQCLIKHRGDLKMRISGKL